MKESIIEIKNLTKRFKDKIVLNDINLKVYRGEIFGLLGPNGAGKTVLIHTLLGLIEPDEGEIKIFGKNLQKNLSQIHARVNLASSNINLQEKISVMENLITFAGLYGVKNPQKKIRKLLHFFGLEEYIQNNIKVYKLSSGENTKLLLCKSLLNDPEILFLDEPTATLDPKITKKVQDLILTTHKRESITIFSASHNLSEVKRLCTRVGFIKKGKLIKVLPVRNLKKLAGLY